MAISTGIITNKGKEILANLTADSSPSNWPLYIAWGSGAQTVAATVTSLANEEQRGLATIVDTTARINLSKTFTVVTPFTHHPPLFYETVDGREVGLFDAASGGNLLYYGTNGASCIQPDMTNGDTYIVKIRLDMEQSGAEVTTAGFNMLVDLFANADSPTEFLYMAYGTGTTAEAVGLTALTTETDRVLATITIESTTTVNDTIRFSAMFDTTSAVTISEVGIFNAAADGTMAWRRLLDSADRRLTTAGGRENIVVDFVYNDGGFSGTVGTCDTL